jgi:hypothetical protein
MIVGKKGIKRITFLEWLIGNEDEQVKENQSTALIH